jgi:hypothetical protein
LLFFQVHDGPKELLQDLQHHFPAVVEHHPHDASETALHSWHLVQFSNPDYNRPIVWRISIQQPDCFTVYPSEGNLQPGESHVIVFGVKPLASLLAHATQQLNAHREGVNQIWANVYADEAHLPAAPFLIHYHYALVIPCRPAGEDNLLHPPRDHHHHHRRHATTTISPSATATHPHANDSPWQRAAQPQQPVRTMFLSAHVNANHSLNEFRRSTLVPFSKPAIRDEKALVFCAPQLMEGYPSIWKQRLENLELERCESIQAQAYRTETACQKCGTTWGARLEELGQAHVLAKLECEQDKQKRDQTFDQMHHVLTQLLLVATTTEKNTPWTERQYQLLFAIHKVLVDYRGAAWLTRRQRKVLLRWEMVTDCLCLQHNGNTKKEQGEEHSWVPWRHAGVYKHALCTDSVFSVNFAGEAPIGNDSNDDILWKDEPQYLHAFAHLTHSPGAFCLGPQEDPNHLQEPIVRDGRFGRRQQGCATDMFMDDPICGLQSAWCVLCEPRSLMVHGIYDRVLYPGTVIRRPKLAILPPLESHPLAPDRDEVRLEHFIKSKNQLLYYEVQNVLDLESLLLVDSWCKSKSEFQPSLYSFSLRNYLRNIPPPGAGRFPLSTEVAMEATEDATHATRIKEFFLDDEKIEGASESSTEENSSGQRDLPNPNNGIDFQPHHHAMHHARGQRVHNLLWVLSTHLGWTPDDNQGAASVYVDRRILIGAQWFSISLMAAPLFWTLLARYTSWIPATPVDYPLRALPFSVESELR